MAQFIQWIQDHADWNDPRLTDVQRCLRYLKRYPDEHPRTTLPYLFKHFKEAVNSDRVLNILNQRIQNLGDAGAEELYNYLNENNPNLLKEQTYIHILSLGAPILFWKYFNPSGAGVGPEYVRGLFNRLTNKQKTIYAAAALRLSGYLLQFLNSKQKTNELCMIAVTTDGAALSYVPKNKRSDKIVAAAVSRSASAMEYASKEQRIKFIELAVMGSGQKWGHHRIGSFSEDDWKRTWAKEVFKSIGEARKTQLYNKWKEQRKNDANDWHNDYASR